MAENPIKDFQVDPADIQYIGENLQRPECILAEPNGSLWSADARGGVVKISPDGSHEIITQTFDASFKYAADDASWFTEGTLPNGLAFAENGDILISNLKTVYIGSLRGTRIPYFHSPVAGLPMVHWI